MDEEEIVTIGDSRDVIEFRGFEDGKLGTPSTSERDAEEKGYSTTISKAGNNNSRMPRCTKIFRKDRVISSIRILRSSNTIGQTQNDLTFRLVFHFDFNSKIARTSWSLTLSQEIANTGQGIS